MLLIFYCQNSEGNLLCWCFFFFNFLCLGNQIADFLPVPKSWTFCSAIRVLMPTAEVLNQDTGMSILFKVYQGKETVLILYFQVIHKYYWKYLKHAGMFNRLFFFILILILRHFNVWFQMVNIQQSIRVSWTRVEKERSFLLPLNIYSVYFLCVD